MLYDEDEHIPKSKNHQIQHVGMKRNTFQTLSDDQNMMEIHPEHEIPSESSRNHVRVGRFEWEEAAKML